MINFVECYEYVTNSTEEKKIWNRNIKIIQQFECGDQKINLVVYSNNHICHLQRVNYFGCVKLYEMPSHQRSNECRNND